MYLTPNSIIVGIDIHKYVHQAVALDCFGQDISQLHFDSDDSKTCFSWLSTLGDQRNLIIGIEDISGMGRRLAQELLDAGFTLRYVPPALTDRERKHTTQRDKTDYLDAKRVGKVIIAKSEETLPADISVPQSDTVHLIDLLLQERTHLVKEQTALKNQLHALLHQQFGNSYTKLTQKKRLFCKTSLTTLISTLKQMSPSALVQSILRHITRLQLIKEQLQEINTSIAERSSKLAEIPALTSLRGCGTLTAAKIMAEVKTITRFATADKLAKYAGIAPVLHASGQKCRVYTNRAGNRKLNQAIHTIALTQIGNNGNPQAKVYYQKKCAEGKSKLWAIRCLKRQIVKYIFTILTNQHRSIQMVRCNN